MGIVTNCRGIFFSPICDDLGFGLGDLTLYTTFYGIAAFAAVPLAGRILPRCNLRVVLGLSAVAMAGAQFASAYFDKLVHWYVAAVVQGICCAFLMTLTVPLLINNWFASNKGFVLGFVGAGSGLVGAVMNAVCGTVISQSGWREGYRLLGIVLFVLLVPLSALVPRYRPEDKGIRPYGETALLAQKGTMKDDGISAAQALRGVSFWSLLIIAILVCSLTAYNQMLSGYGLSLGLSTAFSSMLISVAMVGNILIKLLLGYLNDHKGVRFALWTGVILLGISFLLLLVPTKMTLLAGATLIGTSMALSVVLFPVMTQYLFGERDYAMLFSYISMASTLFGAFGFSIFGKIIEKSAGYRPSIILAAGGVLVVAIAAGLALHFKPKREMDR